MWDDRVRFIRRQPAGEERPRRLRRSDVIWRELSLVLQTGEADRIEPHLAELEEKPLHPLFRAAVDAQILWARGEPDEALARIQASADQRKLGPHEILLKGLIHYERGEVEEAEPYLLRAEEIGVVDGRLVLNLAGVAMARGDLDGARRVLQRSLAQETNQWRVWLMLGSVLAQLGQPEKARDAFLAVTRLAPGFEPGWTHAAGLMVDLGEPERAVELLRPVAEREPRFIEVQLGLIQLLKERGEVAEVLDRLRQVAARAADPGLLLDVAEVLLKVQAYEEVVAILDRVQDIADDRPKLWFLRGEVARAAGEEGRANATQHYREALIRDAAYLPAREAIDLLLPKR